MEKIFKSLSLFEFQNRFRSDDDCMEHLSLLKWPNGFVCERCQNQKYCKGTLRQTRQCTKCGYQATPTSGTLFHKVKFPLLKAFYIVYFMSTNKKGISSTELSRKLDLRQKTCWSFRTKVSKAMKRSEKYPMDGQVEVDEFVVGQQEEGVVGRKNDKKKTVIIAIQKEAKGVKRMYARVIGNCSNAKFKPFFEEHISKNAQIKTDGWSGYTPFKKNTRTLYKNQVARKEEISEKCIDA